MKVHVNKFNHRSLNNLSICSTGLQILYTRYIGASHPFEMLRKLKYWENMCQGSFKKWPPPMQKSKHEPIDLTNVLYNLSTHPKSEFKESKFRATLCIQITWFTSKISSSFQDMVFSHFGKILDWRPIYHDQFLCCIILFNATLKLLWSKKGNHLRTMETKSNIHWACLATLLKHAFSFIPVHV